MKTDLAELLKDEQGVTAVEYAVIAGLIIAAMVATLTSFGTKIKGLFQSIMTGMPGATS